MRAAGLGKQTEQFSKASLILIQVEELISSWKRPSLQKCLKFITHTESHYLQRLPAESGAVSISAEESPSSSSSLLLPKEGVFNVPSAAATLSSAVAAAQPAWAHINPFP